MANKQILEMDEKDSEEEDRDNFLTSHVETKEYDEEHSHVSLMSEHSRSVHIKEPAVHAPTEKTKKQKERSPDEELEESMKRLKTTVYHGNTIRDLPSDVQDTTKQISLPVKTLGISVTEMQKEEFSDTKQDVEHPLTADNGHETEPEPEPEPELSLGDMLPLEQPELLSTGTVEMK
ncbi:hypothetical protein RFI_09544 [Reticulomyxa filosa]|uniref:Uncharacterized protein n=1 Tax=Reticulomyxa filosa TaxID=46433 RepID=X6NNS8_RETFI|nr:hypothetical protein RFI_09544 [Reticulomyxa filosa]|eukprot:ETO27588.1 hypothetical protein RFI_09544 [Reticulomyxa filosa]